MSNDFLGDRRKSLEEKFFAKENERLRQELKDQQARQERRDALTQASGIQEEAVLDQLVALDFESETLAALALVPLVEVAWADGRVDEKEREAVLGAARECGLPESSSGHGLLAGWLLEKPGPELLEAWHGYVEALCAELAPEARENLREEILGRARKVAEATGGILGLGNKVSDSEARVLEGLERSFS